MKPVSLFRAIRHKDTKGVAEALANGADPNATEKPGYFVGLTALMDAASGQFADAVELLIAAGANVNAATEKGAGSNAGYTALHAAIDGTDPAETDSEETRMRIVRLLLDGGADPNAAYAGDTTPAYSAASGGHLAIVRAMIDAGADPRESPRGCYSVLHGAAQGCHEDVARLALSMGAPVDGETTDGFTPLMTAAYRGCVSLVDLFLEHGADPNKQAEDGRTPLVNAALYAQDTVTEAQHQRAWLIVKRLLEAGADPIRGSFRGHTAEAIALRSQSPLAAGCIAQAIRKYPQRMTGRSLSQ